MGTQFVIPQLFKSTYFGNTVQDYLLALGIFCLVVLGLGVLKVVVLHRLAKLSKKTASNIDDFLVELLTKQLGPFVFIFTAVYLSTRSLSIPEGIARIIHVFFVLLLTVKVLQVVQALLEFFFMRWTAKQQKESPTTAAMVKNMLVVIRIALWAGGTLFALDNIGIDVNTFVAGLGIGGIAVALAAQAVLGDTFSSFAIFADKPFEVGDFIIVGDFLGSVEHIGFKTTRLRSLGGEQLIFANSDLTSSRIRNYKRMKERRVLFQVGTTYQTTEENIKGIPVIVERIVNESDMTRFDRCHFQSYGDFALIFEIVYYVLSPDYNKYMDEQEIINQRIFEEFKKANIDFAYPTQQLYITKLDPPA